MAYRGCVSGRCSCGGAFTPVTGQGLSRYSPCCNYDYFSNVPNHIGFDELDYQLYVAKNNPESVPEFHDHSITDALDNTLTSPAVKRYLVGFFYPTEPIQLRAELKAEIQNQLSHDRWPSWFIIPEQLKYQIKRQSLLEQYDLFINLRPKSRRMPIALYYKAMLSRVQPGYRISRTKGNTAFLQ